MPAGFELTKGRLWRGCGAVPTALSRRYDLALMLALKVTSLRG